MHANSSSPILLHHSPRRAALLVLGLIACSPLPAIDDALAPRSSEDELVSISLGEDTTCATTLLGDAVCWGRGARGRLGQGDGSIADADEPSVLPRLELGQGATTVVSSGAQGYALLLDGHVRAFGPNDAGELGLGHSETIGDDETPAGASMSTIVPLDDVAVELGAGDGFACARLVDGRIQCWGWGERGQLGRGPLTGVQGPADVALGGVATRLAVGGAHACARLEGGAVRCWGDGAVGQLGYGTTTASGVPPAQAGDVPLGGAAVDVVAGAAHACALLVSGSLRCWGANDSGQLGLGHTQAIGDDETPDQAGAVGLPGPVLEVAAGRQHTCARLEGGVLRCWGEGGLGQLGLDHRDSIGDDELPLAVAAIDLEGLPVDAIFTGPLADHSCARLIDGGTRCWGQGRHGQLGLGFVDPIDPVEGPPGDLPDVIIVEDPD